MYFSDLGIVAKTSGETRKFSERTDFGVCAGRRQSCSVWMIRRLHGVLKESAGVGTYQASQSGGRWNLLRSGRRRR